MDKRKVLLATIAASSAMAIGIGYSNKDSLIINNVRVKDISKIKDKELGDLLSRDTNITNAEKIKKYNIVELTSFDYILDESSSSYVINMNFKNSSENILNDLELDFAICGPEGDISVKKTNNKELKPNEEFAVSLNITAQNILDTCIKEGEPKNVDNFKNVFEIHTKNNSLYLRYDYTYKNEIDDNLIITNELDFNGDISYTSLNLVPVLDDSTLPKTHVDSGAYLNLVKPEEKNPFNSIDTLNVRIEIDDDFNFKVIGDFQNVGTTDIDSFAFQPRLTLFDYPMSYESSTIEQDKEVIKPGETFTLTVFVNKEDLIFSDTILNTIDNTYNLKNKEGVSLLKTLIKNRLISIGYSYHYTIGNHTTSVHTKYTNTAKLLEMNLFEYETIIDE